MRDSSPFHTVEVILKTVVCCVSLIIFWIQFSIWLYIIVDCGLDLIVSRYYSLYWVLVILFLLRILLKSDVIQFYFSLFLHCFQVIILGFSTISHWKRGNSNEINNRSVSCIPSFELESCGYSQTIVLLLDHDS